MRWGDDLIKIGICDDDVNFTTKLESMIYEIARENGIKVDVDVFFDGLPLLDNVMNSNVRYDMLFLDIEMKHLDGLKTASKIRELDELVYLIYITNYESYAIEAYEVRPFQFVLKPIEKETIQKYFLIIYEKICSGDMYFIYKYQKAYCKELFHNIMYFESDKRKVNIHLANGRIQSYYDKLSSIEEQLELRKVNFWRIHRSLLVNERYIRKKAYDHIVLHNGTVFYISEDRRKELNEQYATMIEKEME